MIAVIQTIPARLERARRQAKEFGAPCDIYVDEKMEGTRIAFVKSLQRFNSQTEYRLHMQDDLILSDGLADYAKAMEEKCRKNGWEHMTFYANARKGLRDKYTAGENIVVEKPRTYTSLLCTLMSPRLVKALIDGADLTNTAWQADDEYAAEVMKKSGIAVRFHLPNLVQHDVSVRSTVGNTGTKDRTSNTFDPNFITNWTKNEQATR